MKLQIFLASFLFLGLATGAERATFPSDFNSDTIKKLAKSIVDGAEDEGVSYKAEAQAQSVYESGEEFYFGGLAKLEYVTEFKCKVEELKAYEKIMKDNSIPKRCHENFENRTSSDCKKNITFAEVYPVVNASADDFHQKYKCDGYASGVTPLSSNSNADKKLWKSLYFKVLNNFINKVKADLEFKAGEYELANVKQCNDGLEKRVYALYNKGNLQCSIGNETCSEHADCCSGVCLDGGSRKTCQTEIGCYKLLSKGDECGELPSGKVNPYCDTENNQGECIEVNYNTSEIGECTFSNYKPTANRPCCSGATGADGKCKAKLVCDTCVKSGIELPQGERCCPGYYKSPFSNRCIQDFPPLLMPQTSIKKRKSFIEKVFDFIIPSAHAEDPNGCIAGVNCQSSLTPEQRELIEAAIKDCLDPNSDGSAKTQAQIDTCLKEVDQDRADLVAENIKNGVDGEIWSKEKYMENYNRVAITSKTKSDFKACKFNSFNDAWVDANALEKNAEIVVRGFEYLFSGKGTVDYWYQDGNRFSMYERAQQVAQKLRRYRTDLINEFKEIDRKMACKCIAASGPSNHPDKAGFYNSSCAEERAELGDSTGLEEEGSGTTEKEASVSKIDLGGSGISHERLIMDFLELRMNAQMNRFKQNAELEMDLQILSEFINENNWEKSDTKETYLYDYKVKRTAGWVTWAVAIVLVIVGAILTVVTLGAAGPLVAVLVALAIGALTTVATNAMNNAYNNADKAVEEYLASVATGSIFGDGTERRIHDKVKRDWYTKWFTEYKEFKRYYIGPLTNMKSKVSSVPNDNNCVVRGSSRVCFKNIHTSFYNNGSGTEIRFLLDAKFPEFVPDNAYEKDSQFIRKVNDAHNYGIDYLIANKPSKTMKAKYIDEDILAPEDAIKAFQLEQGEWKAKLFSEDNFAKLKAGIKKYATCISLKECGATNLDDESVYGFGHLFETEEDVNNFTDYFYQHHFHWPSLSSSNKMAYPTMALSSYFEAIVYNLKLVGSLAAQRSLGYNEAYEKFKADWNKRVDDYNCKIDANGKKVCALADMGSGSKNALYSSEFFAEFKKLNFSTGKIAGSFSVPDSSGGNNKFSDAAIEALNLGKKKAIGQARQMKKYAAYMDSVGKTERGKVKMEAQKEWMEKFSAPLANKPLTVGGRNIGNTGNIYSGSSVAQEEKIASIKPEKYESPSFEAPDYNSYSSTPSKSYSKEVPKHGIVDTSGDVLLDSALKNQSKYQRDDGDTLFKIVSKAYYRNLGLILERSGGAVGDAPTKRANNLEFKPKNSDLSKDKKSELKKLLSE